MGVKTYSQEIESPVAAARLFKAFCFDNHNVFPKLMLESFKSIEFVEGTSVKAGSIRQFNFSDANFYCKYTTTEGDMVDGKYKCLVSETKFYPKGSGYVCKMTIHVHPLSGTEFNEEATKMG
ncbi:hypothetical protein Ancab_019531 [Ancistrocladus abbreviatus]